MVGDLTSLADVSHVGSWVAWGAQWARHIDEMFQSAIGSLRVSSKCYQKGEFHKAIKRRFNNVILSVSLQCDSSFSALLNLFDIAFVLS